MSTFRTSSPLSAEPVIWAGSTGQPPAFTPLARWSHACLKQDSPLTHLETTPFLYGYGTALDPITEQRSLATLRTTPSFSTAASDLSWTAWRSPARPPLRHRRSFRADDLGIPGRRRCYDAMPGPATMAGTTDEATCSEEEDEEEEEEEETARPAFCPWEPPPTALRRRPPEGRLPQYHSHPSQAPRVCKVCLQPLRPGGRLWVGIRAGGSNDEGRPQRACCRCMVRNLALRAVCCDVR